MVNWRTLEAGADAIVGAVWGESVRLSFMNGGAIDPARPMIEVTAIIHVGGDGSISPGAGHQFKTNLSAGQAALVIDRNKYPALVAKRGDKVRANDRAGQPWWEVADVTDRYSNLLVLTLTQA